ncbi:UDP-glucose/GDP-mannose dehydrogenase family protein [SAR202 cluster bacterium AD-802-E10_MRT_200m]|nr:UDP-glucose/GDP-mannose dehydrogenase family protein [SAR202 cluster bacterium AD-802-E10_MRT_200m]MQF82916.1 UDP-glucose/GDP-mannose dehydrogenase family protein [SAR202 cluster bacterium AD-802-E10_MRT_200m]
MTMRVSVIGAGHVGLVTGACLAELDNAVLCVDIDEAKIADLQNGIVPYFEPYLEDLVTKNIASGNLQFGTTVAEATSWSEVVMICAGTPSNEDGSTDVSAIESIVEDIATHATGYCLIVEKSTVPVGMGIKIQQYLDGNGKNTTIFDVASAPEFLREGGAVQDTLNPSRIVVGASTDRAIEKLKALFVAIEAPWVITDINTAEMIKHASNSFLAMKISFINAVANICERVGADVTSVSHAMGLDTRIGQQFLEAGIGYGGPCFPKDVAAFIHIAKIAGYEFDLMKAVEQVNVTQRDIVIDKLEQGLGTVKGKILGILGLAFKPDTDDLRQSPSLEILDKLLELGAIIRAYDPKAGDAAKMIYGDRIIYSETVQQTAHGADALILLTKWDEFKELNWTEIRQVMKGSLVFDGRNFWNPDDIRKSDLTYIGIGR